MADYWLAELQTAYAVANGRWDNAITWNEKSLAALDKLANDQDAAYQWKTRKLDAMLSRSYYFVYLGKTNPEAFAQSIAVAEQADDFAEKEYRSYPYRDWIKTNVAHSCALRNQAGDRERAIAIYKEFLSTPGYDFDHWELLQKDFRDLHRAGLQWPDLRGLINAIKPENVEISEKEWQEMGV